MKSRKLGIGLLATAAMMVMAFGASSASATEVVPANTKVTATSKTEEFQQWPKFLPNNAYNPFFTACEESEAQFTTPATGGGNFNANINQVGTGTLSQGQGSVSSQIQFADFDECALYVTETGKTEDGVEVTEAVVRTTEDDWTVAGWGLSSSFAMVAVGVPDEGAEIEIPATGCVITVGQGQQSVIMGEYDNAGNLELDGQLKFVTNDAEACALPVPLAKPAQFEGSYSVTTPNGTFEVLP
jgi:hypothetical protein